jgi:hypothetical protein
MLITSSLDNELLKFIESKELETLDISPREIYTLYTKMIIDILYYIYQALNNIDYSLACCELCHSIFIITLKKTYNTKLAMFLCDRAKTLFIEYINISKEMNRNNGSSNREINLVDIKIYIYGKTIGPLRLSNYKFNSMNKFNSLDKYYLDSVHDTNVTSNNAQSIISKTNELFIVYKQFIYTIYTYLINHIEQYIFLQENDGNSSNSSNSSNNDINETEEYCDDDNSLEDLTKPIIHMSNIYKNDTICNTLEHIRNIVSEKIFDCYQVFNILYIEELLHIDFNAYNNIYVSINKLLIQLQIIIDFRKHKKHTSKEVYTVIQKIPHKDYIHYNSSFIDSTVITQLDIYTLNI